MVISDTLKIEENISTSCSVTPELFQDPDLDIGSGDTGEVSEGYLVAQAARRFAAEERAQSACRVCPIVAECQDWALNTEVWGVVGALRANQRSHPDRYEKHSTASLLSERDIKHVAAHYLSTGLSVSVAAIRLSCGKNTVLEAEEAYLDGFSFLYAMTDGRKELSRVSEELFTLLSIEGAVFTRDNLIAGLSTFVTDVEAGPLMDKSAKGGKRVLARHHARKEYAEALLNEAIAEGWVKETLHENSPAIMLRDAQRLAV